MTVPELCDSRHFEQMQSLAQGAFGTINLALDKRSMQLVVIKSIAKAFILRSSSGSSSVSSYFDASSWGFSPSSNSFHSDTGKVCYRLSPSGFSELAALRLLCPHDNILPLLGYFPDGSMTTSLSLIFPLCLVDLHGLICYELNISQRRCGIPEYQLKAILKDVLSALQHMHSFSIAHCDINPRNILLTPVGIFQVADFGLARPFDCGDQPGDSPRPNGLCTLHYRPPELLFNSNIYSQAIDVWSCGLVFAELLNLRPLLPGRSVLDQLGLIFNLLGTPSETSWPNARNLPDFHKARFQHVNPIPLHDAIPRLKDDPLLLDILQNGMLLLDPDKRLSSIECLKHPWFIKSPSPAIPSEVIKYFITSRRLRINLDSINFMCSDRREVYGSVDNKSEVLGNAQHDLAQIKLNSKITMKLVDEIMSFRKKIYHTEGRGVASLKIISSTQDLNTLFQCHNHSKFVDELKRNGS